jgi:hypothetical protein
MPSLTLAQWGLLLIIAFGLFYWLRIFIVIRTIALFVGILLLGTAGWVERMATDLARWASEITGSITAWAFGVSITWILAAVAAVIFIHGLHPKNPTKNHHAWWGAALAFLLIAGTASALPLLNHVPADVQNGVQNAQTAIGG